MISIDTNVLVRLVTNDDPRQANRARALIEANEILLTSTVLLESEWVLRAGYGFSCEQILQAFRNVLGLPQVQIESAEAIDRAFVWWASGLDFADALHAALSESAQQFATFDSKLIKRAKKISGLKVVGL